MIRVFALLVASAAACRDAVPPCEEAHFTQEEGIACDRGTCPSGLECRPQGITNPACKPPPPQCSVPSREDDAATRQLLVRGFRTESVQLRRSESETSMFTRFEWEPPENASISVCGLFGCAPTFSNGRMTNADQCLWRTQWSTPVPSILDVRDVRPMASSSLAQPAGVRFGCWVFSDVALIAATPLERLPLDQVPDLRAFAGECSAETPEESCVLPDQTMYFGRCTNGRCVRTCVKDEDCRDPDSFFAEDGGVRDAAADDPVRCILSDASVVGECAAGTGGA
jgi:hypothetical protein